MSALHSAARPVGLLGALVTVLSSSSCEKAPDTVLVVQVRGPADLPSIDTLDVTLRTYGDDAGSRPTESTRRVQGRDGAIVLPESFSAQVPRSVQGPLEITIVALDGASTAVARGGMGPFPIASGQRLSFVVELSCVGPACGGRPAPDGGVSDGSSHTPADTCGDGKVGKGETCDIAIPIGMPGACELSCDDHVPCTIDTAQGSGCQAVCRHVENTTAGAADRCCPAGATNSTDPDCSAYCGNQRIDPGETCDTKIGSGATGACPTATECDDGDPCSADQLISAGTCSAICVHRRVIEIGPADGCCPAGADLALDSDCHPVCGDGIVNGRETCDVAIAENASGACPKRCEQPEACVVSTLTGSACSVVCVVQPITRALAGDGCCPSGVPATLDGDCRTSSITANGDPPAPVCGDGVAQAPEWCDTGSGSIATCPAECKQQRQGCVSWSLQGNSNDCSARCDLQLISSCIGGDGCCSPGCDATTDSDCAICGDGQVQPGESCDRGITAGHPGACVANCEDLDACTIDISSGNVNDCSRRCTHVRVSACLSGDGCCPPGCYSATDSDCQPSCGDGKLQHGEWCDPVSTCPTTCPDDGDRCTTEIILGSADSCTARCSHQPVMGCSGSQSDGCCPSGCNVYADVDCN